MIGESRPRGLDLVLNQGRVEASLWRRLREGKDSQCREVLFNRYASLARSVASRWFYRRTPPKPELTDFQQFAYQGLLEAIDRYDPFFGVPFPSFARRRIAGSVADGVARMGEIAAQMSARRRMEQERVRSLKSLESDGDPLRCLSELATGLALGLMLEGTSLMAGEADADPSPSPYDSLAFRQMQLRLSAAIDGLPEKERTVVRHHYEAGLTFSQISQLLSVSVGRISQLHKSALVKLRKRLGSFQ